MSFQNTKEAFKTMRTTLDRYESILKMARIQLTTILETRRVEKSANSAGMKIDLDLTKQFVK